MKYKNDTGGPAITVNIDHEPFHAENDNSKQYDILQEIIRSVLNEFQGYEMSQNTCIEVVDTIVKYLQPYYTVPGFHVTSDASNIKISVMSTLTDELFVYTYVLA